MLSRNEPAPLVPNRVMTSSAGSESGPILNASTRGGCGLGISRQSGGAVHLRRTDGALGCAVIGGGVWGAADLVGASEAMNASKFSFCPATISLGPTSLKNQ